MTELSNEELIDKLKKSWTPIMTNPEWNREWARSELKDRAKETKFPTKHYRVRKYVSEQ